MTSKGFGLLPRPQRPKNRAMEIVKRSDSVNQKTTEVDRIEKLRQDAGAGGRTNDSAGESKPESQKNLTIARTNDSAEETPIETPPEAPANPVLDSAALQKLIDQAAQAQVLQTQLDSLKTQQQTDRTAHEQTVAGLQEQIAQANTAVADEISAQQKSDRQIQELFKISGTDAAGGTGKPNAMFNIQTSTRSDQVPGAAGELLGLWEKAPAYEFTDSVTAQLRLTRDSAELNRFIAEQKRLNNCAQLYRDLDTWGKRNGLLRGSGGRQVSSDAATTKTNIPDGFLPALAAIIRKTHSPSFIFWQFPNVKLDFGKGTGDTIKIPRFAYQATAAASTDRLLSGAGTFVRINANDQNLAQGAVSAVLNEYGLGLNATYPPIAIPQFVTATSMLELMPILQRNLGYDYHAWEDLAIYELWDATSRVAYSDNGVVVTDPLLIVPGDKGVLDRAFARNLYAYARSLQIPTYQNGCYGMAVNTYAATTLKASLEELAAPPTPEDIADVTNMLNLATAGEMDRVSGYIGTYENIMFFESNNFGVGAAGTRGAQTVTFGAGVGAQVARSSFLFGADTIGRGIGQEMEILRDNNDDFGRIDRFIWRSFEAFAALDIDPVGYSDASAVPQQLRTIEVRSLATAV